jgi:hypothetical protein
VISFYETWKDDKHSTPKKRKSKPAHRCLICDKRVNSLKHHVKDAHGQDMWAKYLVAEEHTLFAKKQQFLENIKEVI